MPNLSVLVLGEKAGDSYRRHPAVQDRRPSADLMSWHIWSLPGIGVWDFAKTLPRLVQPLDYVLVSAGIELIFLLVAGTVLCFGFSVRIMLVTL